ncbi:MAG: hypothetical protein GTN78_04155 [Gemmatimonadales bacterium]|nr:hypothetical protein [Xanthomonadales bacterium]NIQ99379.1 hypothetical protein [Gemmatimonadales bacterium]
MGQQVRHYVRVASQHGQVQHRHAGIRPGVGIGSMLQQQRRYVRIAVTDSHTESPAGLAFLATGPRAMLQEQPDDLKLPFLRRPA